ncbi:sugar ABC transporter substrate-binding protein [Paenibacillus sp. KS-LC4]|uniref:ABC transporter substrate-binding protein n=1 Tax=Paenibacillus sp. KS-LC4 TaxID=2979727 RepID=UPI0030D15212
MRQRLVMAFVFIFVVACILSGCSGGNEGASGKRSGEGSSGHSDQKVDLTLTMWGSESDKQVMEKRLAIMNKTYPNYNVNVLLVAGEYDQKVQTMIAGGTPPDIMMIAENYQVYASKNQIIPLDDLMTANQFHLNETYSEDVASLMSYDGKHYGMVDRAGAMVVFYNKDLFDKAGVAYPSKDWTQKEMLEAAKKLTVKEAGKTVQWGYYPGSWWPQWMQLVYQNGGSLFDDNNKPTFDTPQVREALQLLNDMNYKYGTSPTPVEIADMGNIGADPLFAQGKIAMETTGFWNMGSLSKVEGINWDISPVWGETNAFFNGLTITKDSAHQEEAFKVIAALTTLEAQMPIIESGQDAPATKAALASDAFLNAEYGGQKINMNAFGESKLYKQPLNPKWNEMMKIIDDKLAPFFFNKTSLDDTVQQIQQGLDKLYK